MIDTVKNPYELKINQENWQKAGSKLMRMAIAELAYEGVIELISVNRNDDNRFKPNLYQLELADTRLLITATKKRFGGWIIHEVKNEQEPSLSYQLNEFFIKLCRTLEMSDITKAYLIKEINHTLLAEAHLYTDDRPNSQQLACLSGSVVDSALRGHPWLIMGKGRLGFGYHDYQVYAPEMKVLTKLPWFAIHQKLAQFSAIHSLSAEDVYHNVLGEYQLQQFRNTLVEKSLDPDDYFFLPIHPWQWQHWISLNYSEQIVNHELIFVGMSEHEYLPLQSIRTFANMTSPTCYNIKLPLSILNTAVYRGLPSKRNRVAPQITQWLVNIFHQDDDLKRTGLVLLGEVATITAGQPTFDPLSKPPYQFLELLGCLYRDSVENYIHDNELVISQAALIHHDKNGVYLLPYLVTQSQLTIEAWLHQFFSVCVPPLLYWLYRYGIVFSPHGENSLLIHEQGVPKRMVLKDFVDDINLVDSEFAEQQPKPEAAEILLTHAAKDLPHFIFTGLFVVHYRYIFDVVHINYGLTEQRFWGLLAEVIDDFHQKHPELDDRIKLFDIKRPYFEKICLNRVRLFTRGYQDDAERPEPVISEPILNPISDEFSKEN